MNEQCIIVGCKIYFLYGYDFVFSWASSLMFRRGRRCCRLARADGLRGVADLRSRLVRGRLPRQRHAHRRQRPVGLPPSDAGESRYCCGALHVDWSIISIHPTVDTISRYYGVCWFPSNVCVCGSSVRYWLSLCVRVVVVVAATLVVVAVVVQYFLLNTARARSLFS